MNLLMNLFEKWKEFRKHCVFNSTLHNAIELSYEYRNVKFEGIYHIPETNTYIKIHKGNLQIMVKLENWKVYLAVERDYLCDCLGGSWSHDVYWLYDGNEYEFKYVSDMSKDFVYDFRKELVNNYDKIEAAIVEKHHEEYYEN